MKKLLFVTVIFLTAMQIFSSCSRRAYYQDSYFEMVTAKHRIIAILPAEMIYTGTPPKNLTPENIATMEEQESIMFQQSLLNGILQYGNSRDYVLRINVQDVTTTGKLLQENHISVRDSWHADDNELAKILGVDAVVRMRITKKRYMSDAASFGIHTGTQVLSQIGSHNGFNVPSVPTKTNDIYASCNIIANSQTIWNDSYKGTSNYNYSSEEIINNISFAFGRHFPYKRRI